MPYITETDLINKFGNTNIQEWSDMDNEDNATTIADRIDAAIEYAESYVEARLKGSRYAVPLTGSNAMLNDIIAGMAGWWLYQSRGLRTLEENTKFDFMVRQNEKLLNSLAAGSRNIDSPMAATISPTGPVVI